MPTARTGAASATAAAARSRSAPSARSSATSRDLGEMDPVLQTLCARVAERLQRAELAAASLTLKLRRSDRYTTTHACRPRDPTMRAETILATVRPTLAQAARRRELPPRRRHRPRPRPRRPRRPARPVRALRQFIEFGFDLQNCGKRLICFGAAAPPARWNWVRFAGNRDRRVDGRRRRARRRNRQTGFGFVLQLRTCALRTQAACVAAPGPCALRFLYR